MSFAERNLVRAAAGPIRVSLPLFAATLFLSAFLLFGVQPMFTRMVLPMLGGTPAVWSVAMVFFQTMLLAGYAYAHVLTRKLPLRTAVLVHLGVIALAAISVPIGLASGFGDPPASGEAFWLIGLFTLSVGPAFFAVAANGPLLQAWFARTGHAHAGDPYFLYGASNLGSFLALLSYPFLVEPAIGLLDQSRLWAWGYGLLGVAIAACGAVTLTLLGGVGAAAAPVVPVKPDAAVWRQRAQWTALSFVPSGLLVAVTAHISTDVAAAPFLWVVPLGLFLLTFIITFQRKPILPHALMLRLQPIMFGLPVVTIAGGMVFSWPVALGLHLSAFFIAAMVCHGEMVRRRPGPERLTEFYMSMSFGGMLGGLAAGLIAPQVFSGIAEYPLLLLAALACRPGVFGQPAATYARQAAIAMAIAAAGCLPALLVDFGGGSDPFAIKYGLVGLAIVIMLQGSNPVRLLLLAGAAMLAIQLVGSDFGRTERIRSFYGVHKIADTIDGGHRVLFHGTTIHGAERITGGAQVAPEPLTYYYRGGALHQAIEAVRAARGGAMSRVGIVGLGTGSLACHKTAGETWRFYEIDTAVVDLAKGPRAKFSFVNRCAPDSDIIIGDARLTLAKEPAGGFDLLVIDAFSSDAVPTHLLTREAMALYASKLTAQGVMVMHISNRNVELGPVVAGVAEANGFKTWRRADMSRQNFANDLKANAIVAAVARDAAHLGPLAKDGEWRPVTAPPPEKTWTDDYADILSVLIAKVAR